MWPDRLTASLLAGVCVVLLAAPVRAQAPQPVGVCSPGLGVGLAEIPKATSDDPRARLYIIDSVEPGAVVSRQFAVCNGTPEPVTVQLYAGPAEIRDGSFIVVEGRRSSELTSWTVVEPDRLTVAPGERRLATATIRVPDDAALAERYGVILAELPASPNANGVSVASRVGVRVYLDVSAGDGSTSDFTVESLRAERRADGAPVVTASILNTGDRALDMRGELELRDGPGGTRAGPFEAQVGTTLAPGQRAPVTVVLDSSTPKGPWLARLTARSGLLERVAEARITFPDAAGQKAEPVAAEELPLDEDNPWVFAAGALIGLLALLLLLLALLRRRSRRREDDDDVDATPQPVGA